MRISTVTVALLLVGGCLAEEPEPRSLEDRADVFGRSLVGPASPYPAVPRDETLLFEDARARRETGWDIAHRALEPVPLYGLAEVVEEHGLPPLQDVPTVPRFQTWYGTDDVQRMFSFAYGRLSTEERARRAPIGEELWAEAVAFNESAVERSSRWPLERYLEHVKSLTECPANSSAEECAQSLSEQTAGVSSGITRILYSPSMAKHVIQNYSQILNCLVPLEELTMDATPEREDNFSFCLSEEFPVDAAVVKAAWVRADFGRLLPTFDTDADAMQARFDGLAQWNSEVGDRRTSPNPGEIYTIRLRSGSTYRLAGLHVMTKETRHWQWVSMWWSDKPESDFGADRPASFADLGGPWGNYKLCSVTSYDEGDTSLAERFAGKPSLEKAFLVTANDADGSTWCSNPYIEHGANNARTNCIGCHQHAGSRRGFDVNGDERPDPFELSLVISNENLFPNAGRLQIREVFPSDYVYAFNRVDNLSEILRQTVKFIDTGGGGPGGPQ